MAGRGARHGPLSALFDLTGKVALITGARSGLGQAIAQAFAEAGADIAGLGSSAMPDTKASVTAVGRRFHEIRRDLSGKVDFGAVVAEIVDRVGGVDILQFAGSGRKRHAPVDVGAENPTHHSTQEKNGMARCQRQSQTTTSQSSSAAGSG